MFTDGRQVMAIAHLTLRVRRAKKILQRYRVCLWCI